MGIAILSGVVDSLDVHSRVPAALHKWESHTPGTMTPVGSPDASTPTRFIACVSQTKSAAKLRTVFDGLGSMGKSIEVLASQNLDAVKQSDVVLLWLAKPFCIGVLLLTEIAASHSLRIQFSQSLDSATPLKGNS